MEHIKFCPQVKTILNLLSNKDGNLVSQFDKINENDIPLADRVANLPAQIRDTPQQKLLINNHTDDNRDKIKGYLYLEDNFGFCKTFEKVTKTLGFDLKFKTNKLQNFIFTSMAGILNVTSNNLCLCS